MGFSFDLEESDPESPAAGPEIRRINAPRFSASVSRARPELDSEPESEPSGAETHAEEELEPPIEFPRTSSETPEARRQTPLGAPELLGTIRRALRAGPPRPISRSRAPHVAHSAETSKRTEPRPLGRRAGSKLLGPLAAFVALGLTYLVASSSLVALGPRLARSSPRVPELGSFGSKAKIAEPAVGPSALPVRPEATKEKKPLVETGPLPEGLSYPGKGLIEIVTSERELIYVDSIFLGRGPLRRVPVLPGEHAIKIRSGGTERDANAVVRTAETTRVHFEADAHLVGPDGKKADPEELD